MKQIVRLVSFLLVLILALGLVPLAVFADEPALETASLADYEPSASKNGWWSRANARNSVWWTPTNNYTYPQLTDGYTDAQGAHHAKGYGMHSAQGSVPSVTWNIEELGVVSFESTVYIVQYDRNTTVFDIAKEGDATYTAGNVTCYFAVSDDGNEFTNAKEIVLKGKGANQKVELKNELEGHKFLRIGISTKHANADNDPAANVYFADLTVQIDPAKRAALLPGKILHQQNFDGAAVPDSVTAELSAPPTGMAIEDGKLVIDNTENTKEAGVRLIGGLALNTYSEYIVEMTTTLLSVKDATADDSRYIAATARWADATCYAGVWVRYNGRVTFQTRDGSSYGAITDASNNDTNKGTSTLNVPQKTVLHFHDGTADCWINGEKIFTGTKQITLKETGAIGVVLKNGVKASVDDVVVRGIRFGEASEIEEPVELWPVETPAQPNGYEAIPLAYTDDDNEGGLPYGPWMAGSNAKYDLTDVSVNPLPGATKPFVDSSNIGGAATTVNVIYSSAGTATDPNVIGPDLTYEKALGMHPKDPTSKVEVRSWTTFDISKFTATDSTTPANTFYSVVGITNANGKNGTGANKKGVVCMVYGDKTGDGKHFELLATTGDPLTMRQIGEFNVDITGVKLLKLVVTCPQDATTHSSSSIGFCEPVLFLADSNATKPSYSAATSEENTTTEQPGGSESTTTRRSREDDTTVPVASTEESAPATEPTTTTAAEPKPNKGCSSAMSVSALPLIVLVFAAAWMLGKRKKNAAR